MASTDAVAVFERTSKFYAAGLLSNTCRMAVENITFQINSGEVFALLGPNRAGKTTLVKILLSLCKPTEGRVTRFQRPVSDRRTLRRVGFVHENAAFPTYLTAQALLEYYGALALMEEPVARRRATELLERVGLADRSREPIARFSKGMMQRLAVAQAILNDPDLLVLDEPSEGLDLAGRRLVRDIIAERRQRGLTVLLVSHVLADVEPLCHRVAVLVGGRLAYLGTVAELTHDPATGNACPLDDALERLCQGPVTTP
jgi:ABC-2 type transport system ATP-binding protein